MTRFWWNSDLTYHAKYWIYIPSFKLISQSVLKKSGKLGLTDRRTDIRMDGQCNDIIRPFFKRAYEQLRDFIIYPNSTSSGDLIKPSLNSYYKWVITSHRNVRVLITYACLHFRQITWAKDGQWVCQAQGDWRYETMLIRSDVGPVGSTISCHNFWFADSNTTVNQSGANLENTL